jgi:pyruvate formate lyase activating enzyme
VRVGGLEKVSTVDFPGLLSAVVFTQGCNFRCPYCHNPDLARPFGELRDEEEVIGFLETRVRYLDGVVISGGEPTLAEDLGEYVSRIKALGFRVKLDTNGSRPEAVESLVSRNLVDYVALDLKSSPAAYPSELAPPEESRAVLETVGLLKRLGRAHEFRCTCCSPFVDGEAVLAMAKAARGEAPLFLQEVKPTRVLNPGFMARYPDQPGPAELARFREIALPYLPCHLR